MSQYIGARLINFVRQKAWAHFLQLLIEPLLRPSSDIVVRYYINQQSWIHAIPLEIVEKSDNLDKIANF